MTSTTGPTAPTGAIAALGVAVALVLSACAPGSTASSPAGSTPGASRPAASSPAATSPAASRPAATTSPTRSVSATPSSAAGVYIDLAEYQANKATYDAAGDVVLFFHASWCPTCKRADGNLRGQPLPAGLTVVKADYDDNDDLKSRYGVTVQHTFVQVDPAGQPLAKFTGSDTAEEIARRTV